MTAEVAILNKSAVALAADSTVTIGSLEAGPSHKTYNTVNKLFTLSKRHPVGVMIFGNAELMGVPWETIIKQYRHELGRQSYATINQYAEEFLKHLQQATVYFPDDQQRLRFKYTIFNILERASELIDAGIDGARKAGTDEKEAAEKMASFVCDMIYKQSLLKCVDEDFKNRLIEEYSTELTEATDAALEDCVISPETKSRLSHAAVHQLCSDRKSDSRSGVVLAGFGNDQFFPAVHAVSPQLVLLNRLIYSEEPEQCFEVGFQRDSALIPFAQQDVVHTFLQGINPEYIEMLKGTLETVFNGLPRVIATKLTGAGGLEARAIEEITESIKTNSLAAKDEFFVRLKNQIFKDNIRPLLDVIGMLPKDELAAMAEALVNLTSVKRKMSYGRETVGGPVDVAVISKGDGFIWISRKHYFRPELNLQFSQSYLER